VTLTRVTNERACNWVVDRFQVSWVRALRTGVHAQRRAPFCSVVVVVDVVAEVPPPAGSRSDVTCTMHAHTVITTPNDKRAESYSLIGNTINAFLTAINILVISNLDSFDCSLLKLLRIFCLKKYTSCPNKDPRAIFE